MVVTVTPSHEQISTVPLKVLVDREKDKVLFAEANKDFVDVLLSFLTLPLGTIARLVAKESNMKPVRIGSLSSLYESVTQLEVDHLWTPTCKEMLVQPRNSMEAYCQLLKLNIDDTNPTKYFLCSNLPCNVKYSGSLLSTFENQRCRCGKLMTRVMKPELTIVNGFANETATFIVCDDLCVMPNVLGTSIDLLQKLGIEDMSVIEELAVHVSKNKVLDLLKLSFLSKTPLTDIIIKKKQYFDKFDTINRFRFEAEKISSDEGRQVIVKVLLRKSNSKILFAEAEENFVDFLCSFLTFPLGGVLHMLKGSSSFSCIDKLYKSISELSPDRHLRSQELKNVLANPQCAPKFALGNQFLPIGEACLPFYYCNYKSNCGRNVLSTSPCNSCHFNKRNGVVEIVDPKSYIGESSSRRGFVKGPSMYMVTDDLVVTPMSSISGLEYLNRLKVPLNDVEERVINIGLNEGLGILIASLSSTSVLTIGLKHSVSVVKKKE